MIGVVRAGVATVTRAEGIVLSLSEGLYLHKSEAGSSHINAPSPARFVL